MTDKNTTRYAVVALCFAFWAALMLATGVGCDSTEGNGQGQSQNQNHNGGTQADGESTTLLDQTFMSGPPANVEFTTTQANSVVSVRITYVPGSEVAAIVTDSSGVQVVLFESRDADSFEVTYTFEPGAADVYELALLENSPIGSSGSYTVEITEQQQ